jgi:hypothetical protein
MGGHNDESHNHNDVGNFIVYADGRPVLVDAGAQTYTAQTFSSRRYELWNNQSGFHNLPTINGVMQREGATYSAVDVAYEADDRAARLTLDLARAYPEAARVQRWQRAITLHRDESVEVSDEYRLEAFVEPFTLNYLTPLAPDAAEPGRVLLREVDGRGRVFALVYDSERFVPSVERIAVADTRMRGSWGETLHRVVLTSKRSVLSDAFSIRLEAR